MKSAAVIGCGKVREGKEGWAIGHAHANAYRKAFPDIRLCGVDIDADNLRVFGEAFGLPPEQLFGSTEALYAALTPDAVSVCTWPGLHHAQVVEAAKRGVKAITCEKPLALDGSEIDQMLAACAKANTRLAVAHQRRHNAAYIKARELLQAGVIGERCVVHARVGDGWDILSWTVHWFDMASCLLDDEPVSVLAGMDHTGTRRYGHAVEDNSVIFVEYRGGDQAVFVTGPDAVPPGSGMYVVGPKGVLRFVSAGVEVMSDSRTVLHEARDEFGDGYVGLFQDLWAGVLDPQRPVRCGAEHTAMATRLAYAAHESARTMRRIALPPRDLGFAPLEIVQHPPVCARSLGRVVLLADNHHADPPTNEGGREGLLEALLATGAEQVHLVKAEEREPTHDDLAGADLLVLYHTQRTSSPAVRQVISRWIGGGRPTLIAHCGIGAYPDWPQFRAWIGRYWVWGGEDKPISGHPHVPCELRVVDRAAFDPGFDTAWLPRDEVYVQLAEAAPLVELVTATYPDGEAHIAWHAAETPHVVTWTPGHRREIWGLPAVRRGLRASARLAKAGSNKALCGAAG